MQALTFILAFVAVLALIGALAWLVRRFAGNRLGANTNRGRMPRLAVIDAAAVDGRRRLVLVRRDNVEHLLMIGGPTDIVVEPNILRAMPARDQMASRAAVGGVEAPPRIAPLPDAANWSDDGSRSDGFDHAEPQMPEPPPRPSRPAFADELRRPAAPPPPERRIDPFAGLVGRAEQPALGAARRDAQRSADFAFQAAARRADDAAPDTPGRSPEAAAADARRAPCRRPAAAVTTARSPAGARTADVVGRSKPRRDGAAAGSSTAPAGRAERTARRCAAGRT